MTYQELLGYLKKQDMTMSRYERGAWDHFVRDTGLRIRFPYIHITGSNGKGSTANFLFHIYQAAGYKTALFSKPYLLKPNEMMHLNDGDISDEDMARIFTEREDLITKSDLSSFEILTYIAFTYFNEQNVDVAIIEAGMGGEMDSTNLDSPSLLSIITSVSLEHTSFLGRTVGEIARSKAGIIKENSQVLVGHLEESALDVIKENARRKQSDFHEVDDFHNERCIDPFFHFDYRPYADLEIMTPASYMLPNAALAIEAIKLLRLRFPVGEEALRKGLQTPMLPCRFERHRNILLDGAHNPEAIDALMPDVVSYAKGRPIRTVFASFKDKNIAVMLPRIQKDSSSVTLTTFGASRARKEMDYFLYAEDFPFVDDYRLCLSDYLLRFPDDLILVTGSLAFVTEVRLHLIKDLGL